MAIRAKPSWSAYTYAWWLTGNESDAERALREGAASLSRRDEGLLPLLAAVRSAAGERTMCPASELALLHDLEGLELPEAAGIVAIEPPDAPTELAHGRLEALEHPLSEIEHPERLGGLAVGNPADVAHARQCDGCGRVRGQLSEGRKSIKQLPALQPPDRLVDDLGGDNVGESDATLVERLAALSGQRPRRTAAAVGVGLLLLLAAVVLLLSLLPG
ncbi:MAG: hypothetical protein ACR2MA_08225 [Egibacteraceae bacterium]